MAASRNFDHIYEKSFEDARDIVGLAGQSFEFFREQIEDHLDRHPWFYSVEVPGSNEVRVLSTLETLEDIPPLYVYFRIEQSRESAAIHYVGLSPAWSHWMHPEV